MKTPITYYGGKQNMLKHILPLIPEHDLYCEPFCGGAAVFFAKQPAKINVINDLNVNIINFYKTVVSDFEALKLEIDSTLHSRNQHEHAWHIYNYPYYFSNVQRAWATFTLSKLGFGGQLSNSFGFQKKIRPIAAINLKYSKIEFIQEIIELLEKSTIECDDAMKIIKRFDCEKSFHFIDIQIKKNE